MIFSASLRRHGSAARSMSSIRGGADGIMVILRQDSAKKNVNFISFRTEAVPIAAPIKFIAWLSFNASYL